jgi:hypothetical protein
MCKAIPSHERGDEGQRLRDRDVEGGKSAGLQLAQALLDYRPTGFNRIEIGRVRGKIAKFGASGFNESANTLHFMSRQIVHHHYLSGLQCGAKHLLEVGPEYIAIGRRFYRHHGLPAIDANRSQERERPPSSIRRTLMDSLSTPCPSIKSGHVGRHTTFVEEHKPLRIDTGRLRSPLFSPAHSFGCILLTGVQAFF